MYVAWRIYSNQKLKTDPADKKIKDSAERSKIFAGHFSNMGRLHGEEILKAAGLFAKMILPGGDYLL